MFRPLGIGEIFDRAITIYTRNFVVFTLMVMTMLVPLSVVQLYAAPDQSKALSQAIDQIQHPSKARQTPPDPLAGYTPEKLAVFAIAIVVFLAFAPFVNNAVAVGVAAVYFGNAPDFRASFATVFKRWKRILGVAALCGTAIVGIYVAGVVALMFVFVIGALLVTSVLPLAVILFVLGTVGFIALILLLAVLVICYAFAIYGVSLEDVSAADSVGNAFRRILNRSEIGKALLVALSYIGIEIAATMISATIGATMLFVLHSSVAQIAANLVVTGLLTAFVAILLAVYYYDVRVRREGLDLEADLQRLTA